MKRSFLTRLADRLFGDVEIHVPKMPARASLGVWYVEVDNLNRVVTRGGKAVLLSQVYPVDTRRAQNAGHRIVQIELLSTVFDNVNNATTGDDDNGE